MVNSEHMIPTGKNNGLPGATEAPDTARIRHRADPSRLRRLPDLTAIGPAEPECEDRVRVCRDRIKRAEATLDSAGVGLVRPGRAGRGNAGQAAVDQEVV